MGNARTFCVCQGCGAWKETGRDLLSFGADYDLMFFIEQHLPGCPVTGQPENLIYVSEDDAHYQPLDPEKQWRPESCPAYRPPQEPTFTRYTSNVRERLVGLWTTRNVGGHSDETLVLLPDGSGALDFYNVVLAGRSLIRWTLDGQEHICFEGTGTYFRTGCPYFDIGCFTNVRGDDVDMLRIFDRGRESKSKEFFRSEQSVDNYKSSTKLEC